MTQGFLKLPRDILNMMPDLSNAELRVCLFIASKTIGYGKAVDRISLSQFTHGTGLSDKPVTAALRSLCERAIIVRSGDKFPGYSYGFTQPDSEVTTGVTPDTIEKSLVVDNAEKQARLKRYEEAKRKRYDRWTRSSADVRARQLSWQRYMHDKSPTLTTAENILFLESLDV